MDEAAQKRAGGEHDGGGANAAAVREPHAAHAVRDQKVVDLGLDHRQIRRLPQRFLHRRRVKLAVGLRAWAAHRRTFAAIEEAELDAGRIRHPAHQAIKRIDLTNEMALAEPADGGIARHGADGGETLGDQRRARAHPGRGRRGFAAGMATADHNHVEGRIHRAFHKSELLSKAGREIEAGNGPCFT